MALPPRVPGLPPVRLLSALALLAGGCVASPDDLQLTEGINVCHSTVVEGVDVSEFQGASINWGAVHASGREFAIARVGDGTYRDPDFDRNWAGIHAAGMIRGAYLFFRPTSSASAQAALINAAVGHLGAGDLPVTIDVECMCPASVSPNCNSGHSGCVSPSAAAGVLRDLVAQVAAGTGKTPMVYTGAWFWDGGTYLSGAITLPGNPLWVSGYTTGCVSVPSGWTDWRFWQYTDGTCAGCPSVGPVPGIGQSCDRDRFNGTLAQLQAFAGASGGDTYGAHFVSQSFPYASVGPVTLRAGTTADVSIDLMNIGTHAWNSNTCLGTSGPQDRISVFAGPEWRGPNRPACVSGTVAPGATYHFHWTMHAPATDGHFDEHWGVVQEGVTWFGDPGQLGPPNTDLEGIFDVTGSPPPPPPTDSGVHDSGTPDTGVTPPADSGVVTPPDAGATDAGGTDAVAVDESPVDAGAMDDGTVPTDDGTQGGTDGGTVPGTDSGPTGTGRDGGAPAPMPAGDVSGSGCGCSVPGSDPHGTGAEAALSLAFGLVLAAGRRRREGTPARDRSLSTP